MEECGPDCTVFKTKFSSLILKELGKETVISSFNKAANKKNVCDISSNEVQITKSCLKYFGPNIRNFLSSQTIVADLKGPNEKYKMRYGRCTGLLFRVATQHNTSCSDNQ